MKNKLVTLKDCPIGLFIFEDTLCLKTEYDNDAFIVWSGEFFHGGVDELVLPISDDVVQKIEKQYKYKKQE